MGWYNPAWTKRKAITVDHTKVGTGPHSDFPVLVSLDADADLLADALPSGFDLLFTSADGTTKLAHEIVPSSSATAAGSGGWTWFNDPRAAYSSTYNKHFIGSISQPGDIQVDSFDHATGTWTTTVLHALLEQDDHDNPALLVLQAGGPNAGKILANYAVHGGPLYSRVSTTAGDSTAWEAEVTIQTSPLTSYSDLAQLSGESHRVYCFYRSDGPSDRYFRTSDDGGATWSSGTNLFSGDGSGRPYLKIHSNGVDRIDFFCTNDQPDASTCSIYHFYMQLDGADRKYYQSDGTLLGTDADLPFEVSVDLDPVYTASNSWVWDFAVIGGTPVGTFVAFPDADTTYAEYFQARFNGSTWDLDVVATGGDGVAGGPANHNFGGQASYTGGIAVDPDDANIVYVSRKISGVHQVQKWTHSGTFPSGTWSKVADITSGATFPAARPYVVRGMGSLDDLRVLYWQGQYTSYFDYRPTIMAVRTRHVARLRAWVKVPSLSSSADTPLYLYYGNPAASDQSDAATTWADYMAVIHGINRPGTHALLDSSGNGGHAAKAQANLPRGDLVAALVRGSLVGGASTAKATIPAAAINLAGRTALTISAWVRPSSLAALSGVVSSWAGGTSVASAMMRLTTAGALDCFLIQASNTQKGGAQAFASPIAVDTWQLVALTFDTTNGIKGVRNGVAATTAAVACSTLDADATAAMDLMADRTSGSAMKAEEFRFCELRRSAAWLLTEYNNQSSPATFYALGSAEDPPAGGAVAPLAAYYRRRRAG